jgi:hypothetical protein
MTNTFKEASERVLALLKNAEDIAVVRQNRRLAMDVLRALSLYVKGTSFPCNPEIFEKLSNSIVDKQTLSIIEEFAKTKKSLIDSFIVASNKKSWRTIRLPR